MNTQSSANRPPLDGKWMKETKKGVTISLQSTANTRLTTVIYGCFSVIPIGIIVSGAIMLHPLLVILALLPIALLLQYFRRIITAKVLINFEDRTIESQTAGKTRSQHTFDAFNGYSTGQGSVQTITQQWTPQNNWSQGMPQSRVASGGSLYLHFRDGSNITVARSFDQAELVRLGETIEGLIDWANSGGSK